MMMKRSTLFTVLICALTAFDASAAVVQRSGATTTSRTSVARAPVASIKPTTTVTGSATESVEQPEPEIIDTPIIENKSSQFDTSLDIALSTNTDIGAADLAAKIREQRAALDAADAMAANAATTQSALAAGKNACDAGLRQCITEKCGANFGKCSSDTDTAFGTKLDSCRGGLKCTANEFKIFVFKNKDWLDSLEAILISLVNIIVQHRAVEVV